MKQSRRKLATKKRVAKSKTAPLRRKIRRLQGEVGAQRQRLAALDTMIERTRNTLHAHGDDVQLFAMSLGAERDEMTGDTSYRMLVRLLDWNGRCILPTDIANDIACDVRREQHEKLMPDELWRADCVRRLEVAGANLGRALMQRLMRTVPLDPVSR